MSVRPPRRGPLITRIELFFASFAPLFGLLSWRLSDRSWFFVFLLAGGLGLLFFALVLVGAQIRAPDPYDLDEVIDLGDQVAGHVVGYMLPLLVDPRASTAEVSLVIGIIVILGLILVQANRIHLNPLFYVVGYRVYSCTSQGVAYYLLARSDLSDTHTPLRAVEVTRGLLVERRRRT